MSEPTTAAEAADFIAAYEARAEQQREGFGRMTGPWGRAIHLLVEYARGSARGVPDRAAAARDVEALLRRVHDVTETADDVEFYVAGDAAGAADAAHVTAGELAALVVDAVLGQEQET